MNIHEYQGKEILAKYGVRVQRGIVANNPVEAVAAAKQLTAETGTSWYVIKAQVHAGGRGKGGGVKLAKNLEQVTEIAEQIIGMQLVTPQTPPEGKTVHKVLIAEDVYYPGESETSEFYMSILLNRATGRNMIMYSTEGGMDIEEVAEHTPHLIFTEEIDPQLGLQGFQARRVAFNLGLSGNAFKEMVKFVDSLYNAYIGSDSSMFEINPVLKTSDNKILAVDAKVNIDDNALYRQPKYAEMRDIREENPIEVEAKEAGLNYVDLDGTVGCMVNGAGLAMATMDTIKLFGGEPANFLDVGGGATAEKVTEAFKIMLKNEKVKAILVNIFGGIMRCDVIATGIITACKAVNLSVPLVVRMKGTNEEIGKKMLAESGLPIISADTMAEAATKVVASVK